MDGLSAASSIIAVIQLSTEVFKYIITAAGATKERRRLREELQACELTLLQLQDSVDDADGDPRWWEKINALQGKETPLYRLGVALDVVKGKLEPKKGFKKAATALKWPFDEKEVEALISTIQREKMLLQLALTNDCRVLIKEMKRSSVENTELLTDLLETMKAKSEQDQEQVARLNAALGEFQASQNSLAHDMGVLRGHRIDSKRRDILNWITAIDYAPQQHDFINRRQAGTGQWLLNSKDFKLWVEGNNQTLFCPGIPGAGKTMLAAITVDHLSQKFQLDPEAVVAYIYCNFKRQDEQRASDLIASLLKQLSQALPLLPDEVRNLYAQHDEGRSRPSLKELSRTLQRVASIYGRVYIIVDALDECQALNLSRQQFLEELFDLQDQCAVNIFATSRLIPEIEEEFQGMPGIEIRASEEDVRRYIDGQILRLPRFVSRSPELQEEIKAGITKSVEGMFLLAQLHLDSLLGKRSVKAIRRAIKRLPSGSQAYDYAYADAMQRIEGQPADQRDLAIQALQWITCATESLTTPQLQHALAVEVGERDFDEDNISSIDDIVSACAGLITVSIETDIVRLVHYTTQEYFQRKESWWLPDAEEERADTCITYLSFHVFETGCCTNVEDLRQRLKEYPLYAYSAMYWGYHTRHLVTVSQQAVEFLESEDLVQAALQADIACRPQGSFRDKSLLHGATGLHFAAYIGSDAAASAALRKYNIDSVDYLRRTPLVWAVDQNRERVVRLLLDKGADPELEDERGRGPLHASVKYGFPIMSLLIKHGADPKCVNLQGETPLNYAVKLGSEGAVSFLLEIGANPESKDINDQTPLINAAKFGRTGAANRLLECGVATDCQDVFGRTPLMYAILQGHEALATLLLEKSRDLEIQDEYDRTAVAYAARMGIESLFSLLIDRGVTLDSGDVFGRRPLHHAARGGHDFIVRVLLDKGGDMEWKDEDGRTAIFHAIGPWCQHLSTVSLLVESGADVEAKDNYGDSPLTYARLLKRDSIIQYLVDRGAALASEVSPPTRL